MPTPIASGWTDDDRERWPTRSERNNANDDAQVRVRRTLRLLEAAHGSVIHDLTVVIDGGADRDVRDACEDARRQIEDLIAGLQAAVRYAVDASGCEVNERAATAVAAE